MRLLTMLAGVGFALAACGGSGDGGSSEDGVRQDVEQTAGAIADDANAPALEPVPIPHTFSGKGGTQTAPFIAESSGWRICWQILDAPLDNVPIFINVLTIDTPSDEISRRVASISFRGDPGEGDCSLVPLNPGAYYLDVSTGTDWRITIEP